MLNSLIEEEPSPWNKSGESFECLKNQRKMDQEQNSNLKKRRLFDGSNSQTFVSRGINTEYDAPMMLNAWTQTDLNDFPIIRANDKEVKDRILRLEERQAAHAILLSEVNISKQTILHENSLQSQSGSSIKYKIVAEGEDIKFQPIDLDPEEPDSKNSSPVYPQQNDGNQSRKTYIRNTLYSAKSESNKSLSSNNEDSDCLIADSPSDMYKNHHQNLPLMFTQTPIIAPSATSPVYQNSSFQNPPLSGTSSPLQIKVDSSNTPKTVVLKPAQINESAKPKRGKSMAKTHRKSKDTPSVEFGENVAVVEIGVNKTKIPADVYQSIDWSSSTSATRKLLTTCFDRETLATHSLTGKPSPAFQDRIMPIKEQLDANIITDIVLTVSQNCKVPEREVRSAITTKCADENKMLKMRQKKLRNSAVGNKENAES